MTNSPENFNDEDMNLSEDVSFQDFLQTNIVNLSNKLDELQKNMISLERGFNEKLDEMYTDFEEKFNNLNKEFSNYKINMATNIERLEFRSSFKSTLLGALSGLITSLGVVAAIIKIIK